MPNMRHNSNLNPICGSCGVSLTYQSLQSKSRCLICGDICIDCEILINGNVYHKQCYTKLEAEELKFANQINDADYKILDINSQIKK